MIDVFQFLAPGFLFQILLAVLLLWLFVNEKNEVSLGRILCVSLVYTLVNILIEWTLQDYLLSATLVVQWCFFSLIANRFISIPLPRAALTIFCYFTILLGLNLLTSSFSSDALSENEKLLVQGFENLDPGSESAEEKPEVWALRLKNNLIANRAMRARGNVRSLFYPSLKNPATIASPPPETPKVQANPEVAVSPVVQETPEVSEAEPKSTSISGKEFEDLFFQQPRVPASSQVDFATESAPLSQTFAQPATTKTPIVPTQTSLLNAEQLAKIVEIQNRSTDPRYTPPPFNISALSMGGEGSYAIVDGDLMKEGSVIRTQVEDPRGWKLFRISKQTLFWQPLQ